MWFKNLIWSTIYWIISGTQQCCFHLENKIFRSFEEFFFWERENGGFSFTCVILTIIHHTALKNHPMYILLKQALNLIFNITTLLCWYISCLNQACLTSRATLLWTHIHKNNINKTQNSKRKNHTRRKDRCSFIYE